MELSRRKLMASAGAAVLAQSTGNVFAQETKIRIGVLTDLSGPLRDISGPVAIAAVKQAVAEFTAGTPGFAVDVISADHQNKPDVAVSILRQWFDQEGVDMVADLPNSAVALAAGSIAAEKNKVAIIGGGGTALLTGERCNANMVHWTQDSWNVAHTSATEITKVGGKTWYIIAPNFAYGKAITADMSNFIGAAGGSVVGNTLYPYPETRDFSSYIVQAQASKAEVVCFAFGAQDMVNFMKQAQEFGLKSTAKVAGPSALLTDIVSMGLEVGQGLLVAENFYWDLNDRTRAFYERLKPSIGNGVFPNVLNASSYAGTLHYLKAVKAMGIQKAKASGLETVKAMKAMPTDDDCFGPGSIREDGRKLHPSYLFRVKSPAATKKPGDVYELVATTPAEQSFRPLSEGGCPLIKS